MFLSAAKSEFFIMPVISFAAYDVSVHSWANAFSEAISRHDSNKNFIIEFFRAFNFRQGLLSFCDVCNSSNEIITMECKICLSLAA